MIKRLLIVLGYYHAVHILNPFQGIRKGIQYYTVKDTSIHLVFNLYFQQSCNVTLIFFTRYNINHDGGA